MAEEMGVWGSAAVPGRAEERAAAVAARAEVLRVVASEGPQVTWWS